MVGDAAADVLLPVAALRHVRRRCADDRRGDGEDVSRRGRGRRLDAARRRHGLERLLGLRDRRQRRRTALVLALRRSERRRSSTSEGVANGAFVGSPQRGVTGLLPGDPDTAVDLQRHEPVRGRPGRSGLDAVGLLDRDRSCGRPCCPTTGRSGRRRACSPAGGSTPARAADVRMFVGDGSGLALRRRRTGPRPGQHAITWSRPTTARTLASTSTGRSSRPGRT